MTDINVNTKVLERFKRLASAKRLAHAYLFTGPAGVGKMETALAVARQVNNITAVDHPDIHIIGGVDEEGIKIEHIRHMLGRVGLRAYEAEVKVFIVRDADRMTTEAANALLKTLEEPPAHTLVILTTAAPEDCLATIRSRCHMVQFFTSHDQLPDDRDQILDAFLSRAGNEEFLKELSVDRKQANQAMLVLLSFVRDVLLYKSGVGTQVLVYRHRIEDVKSMSARTMDDLCAINDQIVRTRSLNDENLNVKMALSLVRHRIWGN